jgi:hypothetical protein
MPSRIVCDKGHEWGGHNKRDAAIKMANDKTLEACECGAPRHYFVNHYYPNWDAKERYEVVHVERLWNDKEAEEEAYDPMLFVIRSSKDRHYAILPQYWVNVKDSWRFGQYAPILRMQDLETLLNRIPSKYR